MAVAPLALPDATALVDLDILAAVPAVAFFLTCAREARSDFRLTETNAAAVAEICRRLDGLPLALQLAAARLTVLPPEALLARLERRLPLLTRGPRDLPERQQTLRAAIGWSYDMLGTAEQRLFRQLGVFVGGFTLEAVEALIAGGPDDLDPLEAISTLVGQSVVGVQPPDEGTPRYRMLETIREFALERLEAAGEAPQARRRHAEFYRDLAERDEPMLLGTTRQRTSLAELERAHDNMRAALAWSVSPDGELAVGIALAGALGWFWLMSGRLQEAQSWYTQLLARRGDADDSLAWAKVLHGSALQLWGLGDLSQAEAIEESAITIFRSAGERRWLSYGLALLARVRTGQGQLEEAQALLEEARDVWRQVEVTYGQPFDAYLRYYLGGGDLWDLGLLLLTFGLEEAQAGSPVAGELLTEALRIWQQLRSRPSMALTLAGLGEVAADSGQAQPAGQLLGAAQALLPATSNPLLRVTVPYDVPDRLAAARTRGDPAAFDRGLAEGQGWTIDRAVDAGLASAPRPPKTPAGSSETVD